MFTAENLVLRGHVSVLYCKLLLLLLNFFLVSLFHRTFQFTKYNGPTNALVYNKTLI
jgi:hypothetical protein